MELLQIGERAFGRGDDVASRIEPEVLLEPVVLAGGRHELPDPGRAGARHRVRVERALDHRQERDLQRHPALLDLDDDVVQVPPAAIDHARDVVRARRVPLLPLGDEVVVDVRHREAAADAVPEILGRRRQRLEPDHGRRGGCGRRRARVARRWGWPARAARRERQYPDRVTRAAGPASRTRRAAPRARQRRAKDGLNAIRSVVGRKGCGDGRRRAAKRQPERRISGTRSSIHARRRTRRRRTPTRDHTCPGRTVAGRTAAPRSCR